MTYTIVKTSGGTITINDNTINTTDTSLSLVGANTVNFGLYINKNFVDLLQHFAASTAPINPLIGQLWYDSVGAAIKYYNGTQWKVLTPPFDGSAGTSTVSIAGQSVSVYLAGSQIIYALSLVGLPSASLPPTVNIDDATYAMADRFPQGLAPGITLATDSNGLQLFGTAYRANALSQGRTLSFTKEASGSVVFDGSTDIGLPLQLSNVVTPGDYTKVTVSGNGRVTAGNTLTFSDVVAGLGYTPNPENGPANSLTFGSNIIISGVVVGSNIFHGNSDITISTTFFDNPMPLHGIISIPISSAIPAGWYICNGQTPTMPNGSTLATPNLTSNNLPNCYWIIKGYEKN
jgi:hypothetical protein